MFEVLIIVICTKANETLFQWVRIEKVDVDYYSIEEVCKLQVFLLSAQD